MSWTIMAGIAWGWWGGPLAIALCLVLNFVLLILGATVLGTKTINVDVWNFHLASEILFIVWMTTGNLLMAAVAALIWQFVHHKIGDWLAPLVQDKDVLNFGGISFVWPNIDHAPIQLAVLRLVRKIPGVRKIKATPESIRERFGMIGDPLFIGFFAGLFLGLLAGVATGFKFGWLQILTLSITAAAAMRLYPPMVGILMEGLVPLADGVKEWTEKRFKGRTLWIGLDGAIALSNLTLVALGMLLVPIYFIVAFLLPGNIVLPFGDLPIVAIFCMWAIVASKGNILQSLIVGAILSVQTLTFASIFAPIATVAGRAVGYEIAAGTLGTSMNYGSFPLFPSLSIIFIYLFGDRTVISGEAAGVGAVFDPTFSFMLALAYIAIDVLCFMWVRHDPVCVAATPIEEFEEKGPRSWEEVKDMPSMFPYTKRIIESS